MEFMKNLQSFLQSYNKSLVNQARSGPYWEIIGPRSFLYRPRSVLSRSRADILPVRPSRLVDKIYSRKQEFQVIYLYLHCADTFLSPNLFVSKLLYLIPQFNGRGHLFAVANVLFMWCFTPIKQIIFPRI